MALTANRQVDRFIDQELREYAVEAAKHCFKGGFAGLSASGHAQPLVAADVFIGIFEEESDNSSGADGDKKVQVRSVSDYPHALAGATKANIGDVVYASADDTLTFTSTSNSRVGRCADVPVAGEIILRIEPFQV